MSELLIPATKVSSTTVPAAPAASAISHALNGTTESKSANAIGKEQVLPLNFMQMLEAAGKEQTATVLSSQKLIPIPTVGEVSAINAVQSVLNLTMVSNIMEEAVSVSETSVISEELTELEESETTDEIMNLEHLALETAPVVDNGNDTVTELISAKPMMLSTEESLSAETASETQSGMEVDVVTLSQSVVNAFAGWQSAPAPTEETATYPIIGSPVGLEKVVTASVLETTKGSKPTLEVASLKPTGILKEQTRSQSTNYETIEAVSTDGKQTSPTTSTPVAEDTHGNQEQNPQLVAEMFVKGSSIANTVEAGWEQALIEPVGKLQRKTEVKPSNASSGLDLNQGIKKVQTAVNGTVASGATVVNVENPLELKPGLVKHSLESQIVVPVQVQTETAGVTSESKQDALGLKFNPAISENEPVPVQLSVMQTKLSLEAKHDLFRNDLPVEGMIPSGRTFEQVVADASGIAKPVVNRDELFSQIVEHAKVMVHNGASEMELQLKPEHLGKIQLRVAVENQIVTASFVAESEKVKQILETNLVQLRKNLQESGIQVDQLMVSVGQQTDHGSNFNQSFSEHQAWNGASGSANRLRGGRSLEEVEVTSADLVERAKVKPNSMVDLIA